MALSYVTVIASGSTPNFSIPFPYLSRNHIKVYVEGGLVTFGVDYNFLSSSVIHFLTGNPTAGKQVRIDRDTPNDVQYVNYTDGSTLIETDLDNAELQALYLAQELGDAINDVTAGVVPQVFGTTNQISVIGTGTPTMYTVALTPTVVMADLTLAKNAVISINGQNNFICNWFHPTPTSSDQSIGIYVAMNGRASGSGSGDQSSRIGVVAVVETPNTGTGPGDWIRGFNVVVTQRAVDTLVGMLGMEITVGNLKADATFGMLTPQVGLSVNSSGSFVAEYGVNIAGTGKWVVALNIAQGTIATNGWAIRYPGTDGTNGFAVTHDGKVQLGFVSGLGSPGEIMVRNDKNLSGLNAALNALIPMIKVDSSDKVSIAAGTIKTSSTAFAFTQLNGSNIVTHALINPAASGSTKERSVVIEIAGIALGGAATDRIALYAAAQTGGGTGGGTGNNIWAANFIIQNNAADTDTQAIGIELNVNNNKADATSDLSGSALKYGYSVDNGGSKISSVAYGVSASGAAWRRGFYITQGAIAASGYAFQYKGDGSNGPVLIAADSHIEVGTTAIAAHLGSPAVYVAGGTPGLSLQETDQAVNNRIWDIYASAGVLTFRALQDDLGAQTQWLKVTRSGISISSIVFTTGVTVDIGNIKLTGTGVQPSAGPGWFNNGGSSSTFMGGSTDTRWWSNNAGAELMRLQNTAILSIGTTVVTSAAVGDIVHPNSKGVRGVNNAGNDTYVICHIDSGDRVVLGPGTNPIRIGTGSSILTIGTTVTTGAAANDVVVANAKGLRSVNNAGTGTVGMILVNATDQVVLSDATADIKWNKANVALGGGAAPTVGTIGGSGPAAAGQRNWLRFIESDGTASFIPVWR